MSVAGSLSAFVEAAFEKLWCDIPEDVQSMMEKSEMRKRWESTELDHKSSRQRRQKLHLHPAARQSSVVNVVMTAI